MTIQQNHSTSRQQPDIDLQLASELHPDGDIHKGATEDDSPHKQGEDPLSHNYLRDQIGHRNADEMLQDSDSDYPEPGSNPEHSGQHK